MRPTSLTEKEKGGNVHRGNFGRIPEEKWGVSYFLQKKNWGGKIVRACRIDPIKKKPR